MKDFFKAYKLYMKNYYPPAAIIISIAVMSIGLFFALFAKDIETPHNYMKTLVLITVFHLGIFVDNPIMMLCKDSGYFYSIPFAKKYHTIVPFFAVFSILFLYDIILFSAAASNLGFKFATDLMVWNAIITVAASFFQVINKEHKSMLFSNIPFFIIIFFRPVVKNSIADKFGFGLPLYVDIFITMGVYIAGSIITIAIHNRLWKKRSIRRTL